MDSYQTKSGFVPTHVVASAVDAVAKLAKALDVPVLLWKPRDEAPQSDGLRPQPHFA